jgi:hypothetical protein
MRAANRARADLALASTLLSEVTQSKLNASDRQAALDDLKAQIASLETALPPALHNEDISISIGEYARANNITLESVAFPGRQLVDPAEYAAQSAGVGAASDADGGGGSAALGGATASGGGALGTVSEAVAAANADLVSGAGGDTDLSRSALIGDGAKQNRTLSLQGAQVSFNSEFHTAGAFLRAFEQSARKVRVKSVSLSRVQEGVLKGVVSLEYAALTTDSERGASGLYPAPQKGEAKSSLFSRYNGYVEDGVDPTILLFSSDEDIDPNFFMNINPSTSNDTKVMLGVYPRMETAIYYNANNAVRAKLTITGDADQFEYTYALGPQTSKSEKRRLEVVEGKLRLKVLSHPRANDEDKVAILLDVENNTAIPLEIQVYNDDAVKPRFNRGTMTGTVEVTAK